MLLSITKQTGNPGRFVFNSEIIEGNCKNAKRIAMDTDAVFDLVLPDPVDPLELRVKEVTLNSLIDFLTTDDETKNLIYSFYNAGNMIGRDKVSVSYLSITCSGRVKMSISAPEINSGLVLDSNSGSLKIGLGFSFQAGIRFLSDDMNCTGELPG